MPDHETRTTRIDSEGTINSRWSSAARSAVHRDPCMQTRDLDTPALAGYSTNKPQTEG